MRAIVVGGAEGGALPTSLLDTPFDYDPLEEAGAIVGSSIIELLPDEYLYGRLGDGTQPLSAVRILW